jgi:hypothetical protein
VDNQTDPFSETPCQCWLVSPLTSPAKFSLLFVYFPRFRLPPPCLFVDEETLLAIDASGTGIGEAAGDEGGEKGTRYLPGKLDNLVNKIYWFTFT